MDYRTAIQNKKMKKDEKWEYLYTSTYRDMYYTVWNLIDDKSEIEDILQNAYMHAYKKIDSLNDPDKFPAWMKRIVINMAFKYQKKKKPSLFPESVGESDQPEPEIADERPDTDPVYFLEDAEARDLLSALIDNLPIEQKQPLLLYHYEGISLAEIAKLLNCSVNTVKSRLRYARKKLRENLEELREKGYSFNGVSPVSLVVGLLEKGRNSKEIAAAAERSSAVVFKTSAKWAAAETAASGSVTAIKVAGTTAGGIAMRIASGALATAFIGGAMYGVYKFERDNSKKVDLEETYAVTSSYSEGNAKRHSAFSVTSSENASSRSSSLTEVRSDKAESKNTSSKNTTSSEKSQEESDNNSSATSTRNESSSAQSSSRSAASSQGNTSSRQASSKNSSSGNSSSEKQASAQYTAYDLINKPIPEIIKLMGGEFEIGLDSTSYKTKLSDFPLEVYIYNYDEIPGMEFHLSLDNYESDYKSKDIADDLKANNNSFSKSMTDNIKQNCLKGNYTIDHIILRDSARLNKTVTANMRYSELTGLLSNLKGHLIENGYILCNWNNTLCFAFHNDNFNENNLLSTNVEPEFLQKNDPVIDDILLFGERGYSKKYYDFFNGKGSNDEQRNKNYRPYSTISYYVGDMTVLFSDYGRMINTWCSPFIKNEKYGFIDYNCDIVADEQFDRIVAKDDNVVGLNSISDSYSVFTYSDNAVQRTDGVGFPWSYAPGGGVGHSFAETTIVEANGNTSSTTVLYYKHMDDLSNEFGVAYILNEDSSDDDKCVLFSHDKRVNNIIYDDGGLSSDGVIAMRKGDKWGYVNEKGETVVPFEYDAVADSNWNSSDYSHYVPFEATNGYISLCRNGQYSLVDTSGNVVIPEGEFDKILPVYLKNGRKLSWVKYDNNWGIIEIK